MTSMCIYVLCWMFPRMWLKVYIESDKLYAWLTLFFMRYAFIPTLPYSHTKKKNIYKENMKKLNIFHRYLAPKQITH